MRSCISAPALAFAMCASGDLSLTAIDYRLSAILRERAMCASGNPSLTGIQKVLLCHKPTCIRSLPVLALRIRSGAEHSLPTGSPCRRHAPNAWVRSGWCTIRIRSSTDRWREDAGTGDQHLWCSAGRRTHHGQVWRRFSAARQIYRRGGSPLHSGAS